MTEQNSSEIEIYSDEEMQSRGNWILFGEGWAAELLDMKPTALASRIKRLKLKP